MKLAMLPRTRLLIAALVVALGATLVVTGLADERTATVYFTKAKGLYVGDAVVVMGVPIGEVTAITPQPGRVRVDVSYEEKYDIPADAKAILVAPSLVTVRHVAFTPPYTGGPVLADSAEIPRSRTAIPVEWDGIKNQLNQLATALGPDGANAKGSLNRLLRTSAANLEGQGTNINATIRALSKAMRTLADNSGDAFGTVRNLDVFITALARSDQQIADFNRRLATVSTVLTANREELATALHSTTQALTDLQRFLRNNRESLSKTVTGLKPLTSMLADNRQKLADLLHVAPHALSNFYNIYDPLTGAITSTASTANLQSPGVMICSTIFNFGGSPEDCQRAIGPLAGLLTAEPAPVGVSPIERNGRENSRSAPGGPSGSSAGSSDGLPGLLVPGGSR